jgi:DNA-binding transcriptional LysR family regulator
MPLPPRTPDLAALDLLVSVADTGSLGRAAAAHRISQPAASQRLQRLERQLGLQLLVRTPTGSRVTDDGEAVLGWARRVVDAAQQLSAAVDALRNRAADVLQLAASLTVADSLFPAWLGALHAAEPAARVSLRVGNSATVTELVRQREVGLGFIETPLPPAGVGSRAIGGDQLVVVVHPGHPWARRRRPLPVTALAAAPLVVREAGSGTREAFEQALASAGLRLQAVVELGSTGALKTAAVEGVGPAVLSELSVAAELADQRLHRVAVTGADLHRPFHAIWHPDAPPTGTAAALLAIASTPRPRRPGRDAPAEGREP